MSEEYIVVVQGSTFCLSRSQIEYDSPNLFTDYFLGTIPQQPQTQLRLSRNSALFMLIVEHLCGYEILPLHENALPTRMTPDNAVKNLRADAAFFRLEKLKNIIDKHIKSQIQPKVDEVVPLNMRDSSSAAGTNPYFHFPGRIVNWVHWDRISPERDFRFEIGVQGDPDRFSSEPRGNAVDLNVWTHLAFVQQVNDNGPVGRRTLYLNGAEIVSTLSNPPIYNPSPSQTRMAIMRGSWDHKRTAGFIGQAENIAIVQRALSQVLAPDARPAASVPLNHIPAAGDTGNTDPYTRIGADILGEELEPHGAIWKMYVEEAAEQDNELVDTQNKNLDLMLLFAALFSAILTAFLIESKNLLQRDSGDTSVALLLLIAQSQQQISLGLTPEATKTIELPEFSPSLAARFVNGLWFTALALSLSAALVAMLSKEWLAGYVAVTVRPAFNRALARQTKYDGLLAWRTLPIIAFLPLLLHLALLLFSLGLVIYLWSLDLGIAIVVAVITATTASFYLITAVLGTVYEACPYVTQLSKYAREGIKAYSRNWAPLQARFNFEPLVLHGAVEQRVSQALSWLAKSSHDPAIVDCTYQAIASYVAMRKEDFYEPDTRGGNTLDSNEHLNALASVNTVFFHSICNRLSRVARRGPKSATTHHGSTIARYAPVLPKLLNHLDTNVGIPKVAEFLGALETVDCPNDNVTMTRLAFAALRDINTAFADKCPAISADAYALISAANLELVAVLARMEHRQPNQFAVPPNPDQEVANILTMDHYETLDPSVSCNTGLPYLKQNAGVALARTSIQLQYHIRGQARINSQCLVHLMKSIPIVTAYETLVDSDQKWDIQVVGVGVEEYSPPSESQFSRNSLVESLMQLLQVTELSQLPKVFLTTGQALASVSSRYLNKKPENLPEEYWRALRENRLLIDPSTSVIEVARAPRLSSWITNHLVALSLLPYHTYDCLPVIALNALCGQAQDLPDVLSGWSSQQHGKLIEYWIGETHKLEMGTAAFSQLAGRARASLVSLIGQIIDQRFTYSPDEWGWLDLSWDQALVPLLQIISKTTDQKNEVATIMDYLLSRDSTAHKSMRELLEGSNGFSMLALICQVNGYDKLVSKFVEKLLEWDELELNEESLRELLNTIGGQKFDSSVRSRDSFIENLIKKLESAHQRGVILPWDNLVMKNLQKQIEGDRSEQGARRLHRYKNMQGIDIMRNDKKSRAGHLVEHV
ncbi:regulator of telomere elongation helicase 1 [Ceratobasidium sp. AG-Ba]|nr:regulator of telomere elongation helicase 1 [Ceratobasidium sp. AG-Ba]